MDTNQQAAGATSTAPSRGRQSAPDLDAVERRRIQNRNAQRRFRSKKSASASSSSQTTTTSKADDAAVKNGVPLRPRMFSSISSPELPTMSSGDMAHDEVRAQPQACDPGEGVPLPSPFDNAYAPGLVSPGKSNAQLSRLYETFTSYFGPLTDAGGAPLMFPPNADLGLADNSITPSPNGLHDLMQWAKNSPGEGHAFPNGLGNRPAMPQNDGGETQPSSMRRSRNGSQPTPPGLPVPGRHGSKTHGINGYSGGPPPLPNARTISPAGGLAVNMETSSCEENGDSSDFGSLTDDGGSSGDGSSRGSSGSGGSSGAERFQTTLHIAAAQGHEGILDMVLRSGRATVDEVDSEGNTALHTAVRRRRPRVVACLLRHSANPNAENAAGWTPVHLAVSVGSVDMVETLVRHGGDLGRTARTRRREG